MPWPWTSPFQRDRHDPRFALFSFFRLQRLEFLLDRLDFRRIVEELIRRQGHDFGRLDRRRPRLFRCAVLPHFIGMEGDALGRNLEHEVDRGIGMADVSQVRRAHGIALDDLFRLSPRHP